MAVKYRVEGAVKVSDLERLDEEGWSLREVLNSRPVGDDVVMVVLLSKNTPDNVSGLWQEAKPTPPKPVARKPRGTSTQRRKAA